MNKQQENRLTMYEGLLVLLQTNSAKLQSFGMISSAATEFAGLVSAIKTKSVEVDIATVGKVATKFGAQEALAIALLPVCSTLYVYGRKQGDAEIQARASISETRLHHMRDTELASFATGLLDLATAHAADIAPFGVPAEMIAGLKIKTDAYSAAIGAREVSVTERKGARGSMNDLFDKADELLHEELDRYMELIRGAEREFYNKYFSARVVKDIGIRHRTPVETTVASPVPVVAP
jgi:hypothetical protein